MAWFESSSHTIIVFVTYLRVVKVDSMIVQPRMVRNVRASVEVPFLARYYFFFFSRLGESGCFSSITPSAVTAGNLINNISLEVDGRPDCRRRKFLLLSNNSVCPLWRNLLSGSVATIDVRQTSEIKTGYRWPSPLEKRPDFWGKNVFYRRLIIL